MKFQKARGALMRLVSVSIVCMGFAQVAPAGMIGTAYMLEDETRAASLSRVEVLLARADVGRQLEAFGVDQAMVVERLNGLSTAELLELEGQLDSQVAGGDIVGIIGAVFVVLLILELVGVTDIFKSF
ncbi:MAG TPA: PA2779 family protein [Woeseiaceae bacterium]|nr:PA2779 family protein [Woeseiaceae bacterium]